MKKIIFVFCLFLSSCVHIQQSEKEFFYYAGRYSEIVKTRKWLNETNTTEKTMPAGVVIQGKDFIWSSEEFMLEQTLLLKGATDKDIKLLRNIGWLSEMEEKK